MRFWMLLATIVITGSCLSCDRPPANGSSAGGAKPTAGASPSAPASAQESAAALKAEGMKKVEAGDVPGGLALYQRAAAAAPSDDHAWFLVAWASSELSHKADAKAALAKVRAIVPSPDASRKQLWDKLDAQIAALPDTTAPAPKGVDKPGPGAAAAPSAPTPAPAASPIIAELERHIGESHSTGDTAALKELAALLVKATSAKPITPLQRREFESLLDTAAGAQIGTAPGDMAIAEFFNKTRSLMGEHPAEFTLAASRARLALKLDRFEDAWQSGRILLLAKADEHDEKVPGQKDVLDDLLAIRALGLDTWSWTDAQTAANIKSGAKYGPRPGKPWTNSAAMTFVYIPRGSFVMGSPGEEEERRDEEKPHAVTISKPFALGATEVTQGQWQKVMARHLTDEAATAGKGEQYPMYSVSWNDAQEFCRKLTARDRAGGTITAAQSYRLPTEAEWEYACRAGSKGPYAGAGDIDDMGWYDGNSGKATHPVAGKQPNAWGLYDMHGNVWEWCQDWYGPYAPGEAQDPRGAGSGQFRVLRGSSWNYNSPFCRSAFRSVNSPDGRGTDFGFRVALDFP